MSDNETRVQDTLHAFLVAWGWFAEHIGLIQALQDASLSQKKYDHTPQTKVTEFLVAILGGLEHLQDVSRSAHPLDMDQAVAEAWGQPAWADYSGVSRTLSSLSWDEVRALVQALEQVEQSLIQSELNILRVHQQRVRYDADLTGLPVSNSSKTYPNAAFGHMDDEIRLGYQAAVVSLESPTYRRLWLSAAHHPGDTVSCTQAEALVLAAEARTGLRPRRRTDLLRQRIGALERQMATIQQRHSFQREGVRKADDRLTAGRGQVLEQQAVLAQLEGIYRERQREERPTGRLAQARKRLKAAERRFRSREKALQLAERRLAKTQAQWDAQRDELNRLQERLARFERDNETNPASVEAEFRLDGGFGTYENVALLIEMGYEVYTKAHNNQVVTSLQGKTTAETNWTRVGANAEMTAWKGLSLKRCPYPLDVGLERFYTGQKLKHSVLVHFGDDPVTEDLPEWFQHYNGRQTIEAGIKEGKGVFYLHRIKVRSEPAIYLQERMVIFAANFIRWATSWLSNEAEPVADTLDVSKMGVKQQVKVGAHVSAQVVQDSRGRLLKFSEQSVFAGKALRLHRRDDAHLRERESCHLMPFSSESHLIAQPLG
jgi:hypothetical protein